MTASVRRRLLYCQPAALAALMAFGGACHLFLDADALVSGADAAPPEGGVAPDGASDTPPPWIGPVPPCAPRPPPGTTLVAVVGGPPDASPPACPPGYTATAQVGYGGIIDTESTCTPGSCACGAPTLQSGDIQCDDVQFTYYGDPTCTTGAKPATSTDPRNFESCIDVDPSGGYARPTSALRVRGPGANSNACAPSGTAGFVAAKPVFGLEVQVCKPPPPPPPPSPPPPPGQSCEDWQASMPTTSANAVLCYQSPDGTCSGGYDIAQQFSVSQQMTDNRGCRCQCTADPDAGCNVTELDLYSDTQCHNQVGVAQGGCQPVAALGPAMRLPKSPPPDPTHVRCTVDPQTTGTVTPAAPFTLCCLTPCQSCRFASSAQGGACASAAHECSRNDDCSTLWSCAEKKCQGQSCDQCTAMISGDAGPDPDALKLFADLGSCFTQNCQAPGCP